MGLVAATGLAEPTGQTHYAVTVRFLATANGQIVQPRVTATDNALLNPYALAVVRATRLDPNILPAVGEPPKQLEVPLSFSADGYAGNLALPAGVSMPAPLKRAKIRYPYECRKAGLSGGALLALTIGVDGKVTSCRIIRASHPGFGREAQQLILRWRFQPAMKAGLPVEATVNQAVAFQLEGDLSGWRWVVAPPPCLPAYLVTSECG